MILTICAALLLNAQAHAKTKTTTTTTTTTTATTENEGFNLIHAQDLDKMMKADPQGTHVFDANNTKTRKEFGLIPHATPLKTVGAYDATKTLPAEKDAKLVFYCANEQCMASHDAAKVAVKAGYTHVSVMADGIQGWKKAGFETVKQ
jgi:rhodanese-related sulfurtransferase